MKSLLCSTWIATIVFLLPSFAKAQGGLDQRINELSLQISKEMALYQKTTIAVVEFTDLRGTVTDFGRFLAEELITRLYQTRKFKVVERQLLNKVLSEQALSLTGVINPTSAKQLGRVLGVDAIVSGTITDLAQSLKVNARLINTETGEIFSVASTEVFKDESVIRLLENGISSSNTLTPKPNPTTQTRTAAYSGRGVAPGMKFEFQDKFFEIEKVTKLIVQSIEILEGNTVKVNLTIENLSDYSSDYYLEYPKTQTYVTDQRGEPYPFKSATQFVEGKSIPSGIPVRFSISFAEVPASTTRFNLVVRIDSSNDSRDYYDYTFRNLDLR